MRKFTKTKQFVRKHKFAVVAAGGALVGASVAALCYKIRDAKTTSLIIDAESVKLMREGARGAYKTPYGTIYTRMGDQQKLLGITREDVLEMATNGGHWEFETPHGNVYISMDNTHLDSQE